MLQLSDRLIRNIVTISGVRIVVTKALEVLVKLDRDHSVLAFIGAGAIWYGDVRRHWLIDEIVYHLAIWDARLRHSGLCTFARGCIISFHL